MSDVKTAKFNSSSSGNARIFDSFYMQIVRDMPDKITKSPHSQYIAQRRFLYCWGKKDEDDWVDLGLMITDDDGMLCNLQMILDDLKKSTYSSANTGIKNLTDLKVNKYNYQKGKWDLLDWNLFDETEDIVAFQKWLGQYDYGVDRSRFKSPLFKENEKELKPGGRKYDDIVFKYSFYAPEKYICRFSPTDEYLLVYCPPDIISNPETFKYSFNGPNPEGQIKIFPFNSSSFSCKFLKKPSLLWSDIYVVQSGDSFELIAEKMGYSQWNIIHNYNKDIVGSNPKNLKPGMYLKLPRNDEYNRNAPSSFISFKPGCSQLTEDVTGQAWFSDEFKQGAAVLRTCMTPNFEEYLSMLSYYVCMFDIEIHQLIQSFQPYLDAGSKVQNISTYLDLMLRYPGFKDVEISANAVKYKGKYENISDEKKNVVKDYIENCTDFCEKIREIAFSEKDNFAFKYEKEDLSNLVDVISGFISDGSFVFKSKQWMLCNSGLLNKKDGTPETVYDILPSNIKFVFDTEQKDDSGNDTTGPVKKYHPVPVLYRVIQRAFSSVFMFGRYCGNEGKVNNFYKKAVLPFDAFVELAFNKKEISDCSQGKSQTQLSEFYKLAVKHGLIDASKESLDDLRNGNAVLGCEVLNEPSVLEYIFNDVIFQKIAPSLWNNQVGPASYIDVIQQVSTRYRCSFLIKAAHIGKSVSRAYSILKIYAGNLLMRNPGAKVINEIEISVTQALREKALNLYVHKKNGLMYELEKRVSSAPKSISSGCSALQLVFCLRDFMTFYDKYKNLEWDDISSVSDELRGDVYNVCKSVHSGAIALTGFDYPLLKNWKAFDKFARIGGKVLTFGSAATFVIDGFIYWGQCEIYHRRNQELFMCLRGGQAIVSFGAAAYLFACFIGLAPVAPVAIAVAGLIILSADIIAWLIRKFQSGIETVIMQIIDEVNSSDVMQGKITVKVYDLNYTLCTVLYEKRNENGETAYRLTAPAANTVWRDYTKIYQSYLCSSLKTKWEKLESRSGDLPFWNLEVIPAGRELKSKGFNFKDIAFITMKRDALSRLEIKKIEQENYSYDIVEKDYYIPSMYSATTITEKVYVLK